MLIEEQGLKGGKHEFIWGNWFGGVGSSGLGRGWVFLGGFWGWGSFVWLFDSGGNLGEGKALWYGYSYVIFGRGY